MSQKVIDEIVLAYNNYAANFQNFVRRPNQQRMMNMVSAASLMMYEGERPDDYQAPAFTIQAGTGIGKTTGYLLPAIPAAKARNKKIVVSTATIALQQQIVDRDLPDLKEKTGLVFTYAIAKGRQRYFCPLKYNQLKGIELDLFADNPQDNLDPTLQEMGVAFEHLGWDGCRDSWPKEINPKAWAQVTTNVASCAGRNCTYFDQCPFYEARQSLQEADVIVANHDLVLSSLRFNGGALPKPEDVLYIFDETHSLGDKAVSHLANRHRIRATRNWLSKSSNILHGIIRAINVTSLGSSALLEFTIAEEVLEIDHSLTVYLSFSEQAPELVSAIESNIDATLRFKMNTFPTPLAEASTRIVGHGPKILGILNDVKSLLGQCVRKKEMSRVAAERLLIQIGDQISLFDNLFQTHLLMAKEDQPSDIPTARWLSYDRQSKDVFINASPISAAHHLKQLMWNRCAGAVLTSATITALGSFDRHASKLGLNLHPNAYYYSLKSHFNYADNAVLHIPNIKSNPKDKDRFTEEISQYLAQNINPHEGSLVLFTSYWQMKVVKKLLQNVFPRKILMQGKTSIHELMAKHKAAIDKGRGSILFGTDSLAEGIDLPGRYCSACYITKLPFSVPDNPVSATEAEYLESKGQNPFLAISVPDAAIKLVQAAGRLIRSEQDTGRLVILDRRLVEKRYGKMLLDDLPPMRRIIDA